MSYGCVTVADVDDALWTMASRCFVGIVGM
jgi:hypothetical protein